jgi:riboflavin kinase / FMN adenylyltransferase
MEIYNLSNQKFISNKPITICLGFFDGLHKGHIHLINQAIKENEDVYVLTFNGDIKYLTNQRKENYSLTSIEDRIDILSSLNVKGLFILNFNIDLMNLSPFDFIEKILKPLNIKNIYIGKDFTFGKFGKGDYKLLSDYFNVKIVDFINEDNSKISSSEIINLILKGDILKVNSLLGRNYFIKGKVVHGLQNGRKINFPTANIEPAFNYPILNNGVYATYITIDNIKYPSMTNIGTHPTIDQLNKNSIETNIFDFDEDIYNKDIKLEFVKKIRDEIKFASLDQLKSQLNKDKLEIKELLK